ncbi:hypothetical protein [Algoriphagus mannitolivorans]|uniref:hypothetical protein n=1 Tax=Algoriphagus mannitolivorans TaxID=226504 RepID=UPI0004126E1D|nr:hypothetical protein [Algoriphagus mannitolivorans]
MNSNRFDRLLETDWDLDIRRVFVKAWELFKSQALLFVAFTLLIFSSALMFIIYFQPYTILFSAFLAPPLYAGFYLVGNKISRGEEIIYPDFFLGFQYWIVTVGISLISQILIALGIFAFVVPGLYLLVAYMLAVPMGIFAGVDLWSAMELSRKLVTKYWWKFFVLLILLLLYNVLGAFFFGVGILITFPMTFLVIYVVFEELTAEILSEEEPLEKDFQN